VPKVLTPKKHKMKKCTFLLFFSMLSVKKHSQKPQTMVYSIFTIIEKDADYCNSHVGYETQMLPKNMEYELRNKVTRKRELAIEKQRNATVDVRNLYLKPNDWVVIYEANYDLCQSKNSKKLHAFKATKGDDMDALIKKDIQNVHAVTSSFYINHHIIYSGQPYKIKEPSFFDTMWSDLKSNLLQYLNTEEKLELKKDYDKAVSGARGS